jgi:hypothetical protein
MAMATESTFINLYSCDNPCTGSITVVVTNLGRIIIANSEPRGPARVHPLPDSCEPILYNLAVMLFENYTSSFEQYMDEKIDMLLGVISLIPDHAAA